MIKDNYFNILNGIEVKSNLLSIKEALKTPGRGSREKDALLLILDGDYSVFTGLLKDSDPKIRKNTAIILGILGARENLDSLYNAYTADDVMYNKAAYVEAVRCLGADKYKDELKKRFFELKELSLNDEFKKHIADEMKQLVKILGSGKKKFIGFDLPNKIFLTTNINLKKLKDALVQEVHYKEFPESYKVNEAGKVSDIDHDRYEIVPAGIIFSTEKLTKVLPIRIYKEMLFIPDNIDEVSFDPKSAAKELADAGIKDYLYKRIGVDGAARKQDSFGISFRAELRTKDKENTTEFIKTFSSELEVLTKWELTNSVSCYDVTIRLVESRSGKLKVLIKFDLLKDVRFSCYRKEVTATTIKPFTAAAIMELAKSYLSGNARVLDPFCGVGTLLVEREMVLNAKRYFGIDILGEAIDKAEKNLNSAGILRKTDLVKKDFAAFQHSELFDEIITDLPFETEQRNCREVEELHKLLFSKADGLLEKKAVMVVYTRNPEFVRKYYKFSKCEIKEDFEISKRNKDQEQKGHLFILER